MSSSSKKDNAELEKEQKQIKYKPEDLIDTDVEEEFKEGDKKGFRQQNGAPSPASSGGNSTSKKPSNEELEKEQSNEKLSPDDLKDTDVEDEFKEGGKKGFRQQGGSSSSSSPGTKKPNDDAMEKGRQMKMPPDEVKDSENNKAGKAKL